MVKNGNVLACLGAEKTTKNYPKTPNQTKPPDFDTFLQISWPPGKLGRSCFFCWVRVFCAVILTTIKLCLKTKKYFGPPLGRPIFRPPRTGGSWVTEESKVKKYCAHLPNSVQWWIISLTSMTKSRHDKAPKKTDRGISLASLTWRTPIS